ncbi:MAG: hypothetical protein EXQ92_10600 [Alphaproteobacteria bacterium]|nr:hypothetical protein [Alphaproteobacteria bacterium]
MSPIAAARRPRRQHPPCDPRHPEHNTMTKRIAVIGAGPAGLVTAKTMLQSGFEVVVFEMGSQIGGTWVYENDSGRSFVYRSLHINTARELTRFSDFHFADDVPRFPDHYDMHRYLCAYADHFAITPRIRFRAEVTSVTPVGRSMGGRPRWNVTTAKGDGGEFDIVAVCTGPFHRPRHVPEFRDAFGPDYLHAGDFRVPAPYAGKRVCIVGAGNSAVDIASDICSTAARTVMVARSGVLITPQYLLGRSYNELVVRYLQRPWIPAALRRRVTRAITFVVHGRPTDLGFKPLAHRVHPSTSATVVADILFGRVEIKQGIERIDGRTIRFADGRSETFDALIAATGFDMEFPFLAAEIVRPVNNRIDLYKRVVAPGWPGLYFVGIINLDTPINYACERQAVWIRQLEAGNVMLPTEQAMRAVIEAKRRWVERNYGTALRHSMQEESMIYYAELRRELRRGRLRHRLARLRARLGFETAAAAHSGVLGR